MQPADCLTAVQASFVESPCTMTELKSIYPYVMHSSNALLDAASLR